MIYPPGFCHLYYAKSVSRGQLYLVFAHSGKTKTPTIAAEFPSSCSFCAILPHKAPTTRPPPDSSCRLVGRWHAIEGRKTLRPRRENTGGDDRSALANFGHLGRQVVAKLVLLLEQTEQVLVKERRRHPPSPPHGAKRPRDPASTWWGTQRTWTVRTAQNAA